MFKEWGFLLTEIWVLLALAALIGLIAGWIIWGGRRKAEAELDALRSELDTERNRAKTAEDTLAAQASLTPRDHSAELRAQLDICHDARSEAENRIEALEASLAAFQAAEAPAYVAPAAPEVSEEEAPAEPSPPEPVAETIDETMLGTRPEALTEARDGLPDDLKRIKGVGPKLERLCNSLGFWHFDQIAAWTADEVAWVDHNLEGFKGRVSRDEWVAQAKLLAQGLDPEA